MNCLQYFSDEEITGLRKMSQKVLDRVTLLYIVSLLFWVVCCRSVPVLLRVYLYDGRPGAIVFMTMFIATVIIIFPIVMMKRYSRISSLKYIYTMNGTIYNVDGYTVHMDDNGITVNEDSSWDWIDAKCCFLIGNLLMLSMKDKTLIAVKAENNTAEQVCSILDRNKTDIIALDNSDKNKQLAASTEKRHQKRYGLPMLTIFVIALISYFRMKTGG